MANIVYGHFDSAGSLHKHVASLCQDEKGFFDNVRMVRLYAGAVAECLLDYEDWKEGLDDYFDFSKSIETSIDKTQWKGQDSGVGAFVLDRDTEIGRSLVRVYLDEEPETSYMMLRNIRASLLSFINGDNAFWSKLYDVVAITLITEQSVHHICDQVVDLCIGHQGWSLGDSIQALASLSGKYHAKVIETYNYRGSKQAVIGHDFDYMMKTVMNEAMRLGMPDHAGLYTMLAANDIQPYIPFGRADEVGLLAEPIFKIFHVVDPDLKSMMIAKSTGRMMAVAAAGDSPDLDACVVTPLALSTMQGSYTSFLNI